MTIGVQIVTCLHRLRRIHKAAQTPLLHETSITCAWAVTTARRPWTGLTLCVYMDVHASGSRSLPYMLLHSLLPIDDACSSSIVCQRPSSNFPYFRIPLANFLLSHPNSELYFVFYTHCFLVCLLHYVCDFIYTCVLSPVLLVLALSRS